MSRGIKITRTNHYEYDRGDRVDWVEEFLESFAKNNTENAVEAARKRDQAIYDQISAIIGGKPHTVESKVQELQERVGLKEYLNRTTQKTAQATEEPALFPNLDEKTRNSILTLIRNKIKTHHGQISIPAVQHEVLSIFQNQGVTPQDINTPAVAKFINQIIIEENQISPPSNLDNPNIGKGVGVIDIDDDTNANSDFFKGLMPIK